MKLWNHPDFLANCERKCTKDKEDIELEVIHGDFKIKYFGFNNSSYFGYFGWKGSGCKNQLVQFFKNDKLLFEKNMHRQREIHFVIGGDGITCENTYFTYYNNVGGRSCISVNNFNDGHIKDTTLGPDCYTGMISVGTTHFIVITEECCTYSRFLGLVSKADYFVTENKPCWNGSISIPIVEGQNIESIEDLLKITKEAVQNTSLPKAYNEARIGLSVDDYGQCRVCMEPIEFTQDGVVFADIKFSEDWKTKSYEHIEFVRYEDVENFDQYKYYQNDDDDTDDEEYKN
jgi:hypothetical protein